MKHTVALILTVLTCFDPLQSQVDPQNKGILIFPFRVGQEDVGEPGQLVYYVVTDSARHKISVRLDTALYANQPDYHVLPYDTTFTPARILLYLLRNSGPTWSHDILIEARSHYLLAKHTCSLFPNHSLYETFFSFLCKYSEEYERISSDGKTRFAETLNFVDQYLQTFPDGNSRDEIQWQSTRLRTHMYEYGEHASAPLAQLKVYEKFLLDHPRSTVKESVRLEIAKLYRIAAECIQFFPEENESRGFTSKEYNEYRAKARAIYNLLFNSGDIKARATARVSLYNLEHGRTIYVGGTEW